MSSHAATISLGLAGSASGGLKVVDVIGHLYVGGAGMWRFHRLTNEAERSVALLSGGVADLWQEVAAGFAALLHDEPGLEAVADGMRSMGMSAEVRRIEPAQVQSLAALVAELNVAAALTLFGGSVPVEVHDLGRVPGWSVQVAAPVFERVHSRWGTQDTRTDVQP